MRQKYKIGDTVFFTNGQSSQSFGVIQKTTISIDSTGTEIFYEVNGDQVNETSILGKAIIQKPRVRRTRSRKAVDDLKQMNGSAATATQ